MNLENDILAWDRKSASVIGAIYDRYAGQKSLAADLVALAQKPELEVGATWLLKRHLELEKHRLDPALSTQLITFGGRFESSDSRLHLLQMSGNLDIEASAVEAFLRFIDQSMEDRNTFVRAWSYFGLEQLALAHPARKEDAVARLEAAAAVEHAASTKVRLRKALAKLSPR